MIPGADSLDSVTHSDAEDRGLMARIAKGEEAAFRQMVEKHQNMVVGVVARMLGGAADAEDISQQVFLSVWKSAKRYKPKARFTTWLFTITRNLVINESKKRARRKTDSLEAHESGEGQRFAETADGPEEELRRRELQTAIDSAIAALPEKQRMAIILRRYEDMPYETIAEVLSLSVSGVKSQLFRARSTLKEALAAYLDD